MSKCCVPHLDAAPICGECPHKPVGSVDRTKPTMYTDCPGDGNPCDCESFYGHHVCDPPTTTEQPVEPTTESLFMDLLDRLSAESGAMWELGDDKGERLVERIYDLVHTARRLHKDTMDEVIAVPMSNIEDVLIDNIVKELVTTFVL